MPYQYGCSDCEFNTSLFTAIEQHRNEYPTHITFHRCFIEQNRVYIASKHDNDKILTNRKDGLKNRPVLIGTAIIISIVIALVLSILSIFIYSQTQVSAEEFVQKCNAIYGVSNWQVDRLSQWTTYSDEFWKTYPRVYIFGSVGNDLSDVVTYSCFDKR